MSLAASRLSQPLPHLSGSIIYCREKPENKADETQKPEYSPLLHNVACGFTALRFSCPELSGSAAVISPLPLSTQNNHRSSRKTLWQTHPKPSTLTPSPLLTFHHGRNEGIIAHILVAPTRERGAPAPHILLLYPHKRTLPRFSSLIHLRPPSLREKSKRISSPTISATLMVGIKNWLNIVSCVLTYNMPLTLPTVNAARCATKP